MSDQPLSDDELLSSYLDGELTAEDVALVERRLEAELRLRGRLDALRAADEMATTPVAPLAATEVDRMIAVALAASPTAANITDLSAARQKRIWPTRLATVAAAVVALALTVPAIRAISSSDDLDAGSADTAADDAGDTADTDTEAASADSAPSALESQAYDSDDADSADAGSDTSSADTGSGDDAFAADADTASDAEEDFANGTGAFLFGRLAEGDPSFDPLTEDLGEFASIATLREAVRQQWTQFVEAGDVPTSTTTSDGADELFDRFTALGLDACPTIDDDIAEYLAERGDSTTDSAVDFATATADGAAVTIGLFPLADDQAVALLIDQASCEFLDIVVG